ncbi:hypothetical protein D3C80_1791790 [compost metagenome]
MDNAFDQLLIINHLLFVMFRQGVEIKMVGEHHLRGNLPCRHQTAHLGEILMGRIAAAHQSGFFFMELRIGELNIPLEQPDEDDAAAVADQVQAIIHRVRVAGGINHLGRQHAAEPNAQRRVKLLIRRVERR